MIDNCKGLFMVRSVGPKFVAIVLFAHVVQSIIVNQVLFPLGILLPIQKATWGLLNTTLLANLFSMLVVFTLMFRFAGLKPKDVALKPVGSGDTAIVRGVVWTIVALAIVHLASVIALLAMGKPFEFFNWFSPVGRNQVGNVAGQFFGNAIYEEVLFRGFLLPQLVLLLKKRNRKWSWTKCFWLGLGGSQLLFALSHIPNRIYQGTYTSIGAFAGDMQVLFIAGILLALVFLLTRNLYAAVGVHAIVNVPPMLLKVPIVGLSFTAYFVILVVLWWNRRERLLKEQAKNSSDAD